MAEFTEKIPVSGAITAHRFVKTAGGADLKVAQAVLGDRVFGVAVLDGDEVDTTPANNSIHVMRFPEVQVTVGASNLGQNVRVMSDANGKAVAWDSNPAHFIAGVTLKSALAGALVLIDEDDGTAGAQGAQGAQGAAGAQGAQGAGG